MHNNTFGIGCEIYSRLMQHNTFDNESLLVHVMTRTCQTTTQVNVDPDRCRRMTTLSYVPV